MQVVISINGTNVGYMEYEILNWRDKLGILGLISTKPPQLGAIITNKIKTNAYSITVTGGHRPSDVSSDWVGVVGTLEKLKGEIKGFDYAVPEGQDPLEATSSENKIH